MATILSDGALVHGTLTNPPPVVASPEGWTLVKVRFRVGALATAFFRRGNSFAQWTLRYGDEKKDTLVPLSCRAINIRP